jgi:ferredoxin
MRVIIDRDRCVASGRCAAAVGEVFDQSDDDGIGVVVNPDPPADRADDVRYVAAVCPGLAITVEE